MGNPRADRVGEAELRQGSSLYAAATGLDKIAGPGLAGVIIAASGEAAVFLADAVSFLFVLGVLIWLSRQRRLTPIGSRDNAGPESDHHESGRRFRWVLDLPGGVRLATAMALLIGGFGIQFEVTNPLMATHVFHLSSLGFGLFGTCMACGGIAGNVYSSRRKDPGTAEFLAWASLFGAAEVVAAVMPAAWAYDVAMVVTGAAVQLFAVSATVYVQQTTPPAQRGHALSAYNTGFMGFVPAGSFLVAGIAAIAGPRWALIGPGAAILACAGLALPEARATRAADRAAIVT